LGNKNKCVKQRQQEYKHLLRQKQKRKWNENAESDNELDEELWNACKMLREACMKAGKLLLSKSPQQALEYFFHAKEIVQIQQKTRTRTIVHFSDAIISYLYWDKHKSIAESLA
jgi:hypothetical protein